MCDKRSEILKSLAPAARRWIVLANHLRVNQSERASSVQYVRSPCVGDFGSQSWRFFKPRSDTQRRDREHFIRSVRKFNSFNRYLTGLLLLCGDIASQPGPETFAFRQNKQSSKIKNLLLNARSLISVHRNTEGNGTIWNLHQFQDLVYAENAGVVYVNETWLGSEIADLELLHAGYTIYRKDRINKRGGGVLIAVKSDLFLSIHEYVSSVTDLEIVSVIVETDSSQRFLLCSCYRPPNADLSWMDLFEKFLDETCSKFDNMLICGDLNLANVPWDCPDSSTGANEQRFVDILNDHFLIQHNSSPTLGNNVFDLVISSVPDQVSVTEVMEPNEAKCLPIIVLSLLSSPLLLRRRPISSASFTITLEETSTGSVLHLKPWTCPM